MTDAELSKALEVEAERNVFRGALIQIGHVCKDNAPVSCDQKMALAFVASVVAVALNAEPPK